MSRFRPDDFPPGHPARQQIVDGLVERINQEEEKPLKKKRNHPEEDLQREIIRTADAWPMGLLLPKGGYWPAHVYLSRVGDWIYHIPNQRGDAVQRGVLSAMGVRPGVWDLFLTLPVIRDRYQFVPGMYMECKAGRGQLTDNQATFQDRMISVGYWTREVRTGAEFQRHIEEYFQGATPAHAIES